MTTRSTVRWMLAFAPFASFAFAFAAGCTGEGDNPVGYAYDAGARDATTPPNDSSTPPTEDAGETDGGEMDGGEAGDGGSATKATASVTGDDGGVLGTVTFTELDDGGGVRVQAQVTSLTAGAHGIHLHAMGVCDPDGGNASAMGHFNPDDAGHACPPATPRHAGDFGNVVVGVDGKGTLDVTTNLLTVGAGDRSVVGRAVIVHAAADDCTTQPAGNSGARIGCGVVSAAP